MTDLAKELEEMMKKFNAVKNGNSVDCNAPKLNRSYTYRKQTIITGLEAIK